MKKETKKIICYFCNREIDIMELSMWIGSSEKPKPSPVCKNKECLEKAEEYARS